MAIQKAKTPVNLTSNNGDIPPRKENNTPIVESSVSLRFPNGYRFTISYEDNKMKMSATLNGQNVFVLDEIPKEFTLSLRDMLIGIQNEASE